MERKKNCKKLKQVNQEKHMETQLPTISDAFVHLIENEIREFKRMQNKKNHV